MLGTSGGNTVTISNEGDRGLQFNRTDGTTMNVDNVTDDELIVDLGDGDDFLQVDFTDGIAIPAGGLTVHGGGQSTATGDILAVDAFGRVISTVYEPDRNTFGNGTLYFNGAGYQRVISFTGLEPTIVSNVPSAMLRTLGSADDVTITPLSFEGESAVLVSGNSDGVAFESLTFYGVSYFLLDIATNDTVGAGNGNDIVNIVADETLTIAASGADIGIDAGTGKLTLTATGSFNELLIQSNEENDSLTFTDVTASKLDITTNGGADTIIVDGEITTLSIDSGEGHDTVTLTGSATTLTIDGGNGDNLINLTGDYANATLTTGDGDDTLTATGSSSQLEITTGKLTDTVTVDGTHTSINISTGDDTDGVTLSTASKTVVVDTGTGFDSLTVSGSATSYDLTSAAGDNVVALNISFSTLHLETGTGSDAVSLTTTSASATATIDLGTDADVDSFTLNANAAPNALTLSVEVDEADAPVGLLLTRADATALHFLNAEDDAFTLHLADGTDALTVDFTNGTALPSGGLTLVGDADSNGFSNDDFSLIGAGAVSSASYSPTFGVTDAGKLTLNGAFGARTLDFTHIAAATLDTITTLTVTTPASVDNVDLVGAKVRSQDGLLLTGDSGGIAMTDLRMVNVGTLSLDLATNDTVNAASGNDALNITDGEEGGPTIAASKTVLSISTGAGIDTLDVYATLGTATLDSGDGDDVLIINSNSASLTINAGNGNDQLTLDGTHTTLSIDLGDGDDFTTLGHDPDEIILILPDDPENPQSQPQRPPLPFVSTNTTLLGGNGSDALTVFGTLGAATINTGSGADSMTFGVTANSFALTTDDNDEGDGIDLIDIRGAITSGSISTFGGDDSLQISGDHGALTIDLGTGDDAFTEVGDADAVTLNAGNGSNNLQLAANIGTLQLDSGNGIDVVSLSGQTTTSTLQTGEETDVITLSGTHGTLTLDSGDRDDSLTISGNYTTLNVTTGTGDDFTTIDVTATTIVLNTGDGADSITLQGTLTNLTLDAGTGSDALGYFATTQTADVTMGDDSDFVTFNAAITTLDLTTGTGTDILSIVNELSAVTIDTGSEADTVSINANLGSLHLDTQAGNDSVSINGSSLLIVADTGAGADQILINGSMDVLTIETGTEDDTVAIDAEFTRLALTTNTGADSVDLRTTAAGAIANIDLGDDSAHDYLTFHGTDANNDVLYRRTGEEAEVDGLEIARDDETIVYAVHFEADTVTLDLDSAADTLTVDYINGNPIPTGKLIVNGENPSTSLADKLRIQGRDEIDLVDYIPDSQTFGTGQFIVFGDFGQRRIEFSNIENLSVAGVDQFLAYTPNSVDAVALTSTIEDAVPAIRVTGTSNDVSLTPVSFYDVGFFALLADWAEGSSEGNGNDTVSVVDLEGSESTIADVGTVLQIQTGIGDDDVTVNADVGNLSVLTGTGDDRITQTGRADIFYAITEADDDTVLVNGSITTLFVTTEDGIDQLTVYGAHGAAFIYTGSENDTVLLSADITTLEMTTDTGADSVTIHGHFGTAMIDTGNENDTVTSDALFSTLNLNTQTGADVVDLRTNSANATANIDLGDDSDFDRLTYHGTAAANTMLLQKELNGVEISREDNAVVHATNIESDTLHLELDIESDQLTVDYINGNPVPTGKLVIDGEAPTTAPGDKLRLQGRGAINALTYLPSGTTFGSGTYLITGEFGSREINFSSIETLALSGIADFTITTPNSVDDVALTSTVEDEVAAVRFSGTSNGIEMSPLSLYDVTTLHIDLATNDAALTSEEEPGAGNDHLTVVSDRAADEVLARGLTNLELRASRAGTDDSDLLDINGNLKVLGDFDINDFSAISITSHVTAGRDINVRNADSFTSTAPVTAGRELILDIDEFDLHGNATIVSPLTSIKNYTTGRDIWLGALSDEHADILEISDDELDRITATTLRIGRKTQTNRTSTDPVAPAAIIDGDHNGETGNIVFVGDVTLDPAKVPTLHLFAGETITQTAPLQVRHFGAIADLTVNLPLLSNSVDQTLALHSDYGFVSFGNNNGLSIGTVDGQAGIFAGGGDVDVTIAPQEGDQDLVVTNSLPLSDIFARDEITITLQGAEARFTMQTDARLESKDPLVPNRTGLVHTISADNMNLDGDILAVGQRVILQPFSANVALQLGRSVSIDPALCLDLNDSELDRIVARNLDLGRYDEKPSGNITFNGNVSPQFVSTLHLKTGGNINGANSNVVVANLALTTGDNATLTNAANQIGTLAAKVGLDGAGSLDLVDQSILSIGDADTLSGITANGSITVSTQNAFTVRRNIIASGAISLTSRDRSTDADDLIVNAGVSIQSTGDSISFSIGDDLTFQSNVTLTAAKNINITTGTTDADPTIISSAVFAGAMTAGANIVLTDNSGAMTFNGTAIAGDSLTIVQPGDDQLFKLNNNAKLSAANMLTIVADDIELLTGSQVTATGIALQTAETDERIVLGAATQNRADTLELSDAELDRLVANAVRIGRKDSLASGDITIESNVSMISPTLHLLTGGNVTQSAGVTAKNLAIEAGKNVTLNRNDNSVAGRLALRTDAGHIDFVSNVAFDIARVDLVNGISAGGNVRLTANASGADKDVTLFNTSATNDLFALGSITVLVTGDDATFTVSKNALIKSASADKQTVHTIEVDELDLQGTLMARNGRVILRAAHTNDSYVLGGSGTNSAIQTFEISNAELNRITAATVELGRADATSNLTVSGLIAPTEIPVLHLKSGADVVATTGQLVVQNLAVTAGGSATLTGNNDIGTFAANAGTRRAASVQIFDALGLNLGPVDGLAGVAATDRITASAPGLIAVTGTVTAPFGVNLTSIDRTRFDALTVASTGSISSNSAILLTSGDQLTVQAGGRVLSDRGSVTLTNGAADPTEAKLCGICIDGTITAAESVSITDATDNVRVTGSISGDLGVTITLPADDRTVTVSKNGTIASKGFVLITADDLELLAPRALTAATITLRAAELSDAIVLGASTNNIAETLELTDAELDRITATTLNIGRNDGAAANNIRVEQVSLDANKVTNLHLRAKGNVTQTGGLQARHLAVEAGGSIDLTNPSNLVTGAVALKATNGNVSFHNETGFEVGTVDAVTGLSASGDLTITARGVASAREIKVMNTAAAADIVAGGTLNLSISGVDSSINVLAGATIRSTSSTARSHVFAADEIELAGVIEAVGHSVTLATSTANQKIGVGSKANTAGSLDISAAELDRINAATIRIGRSDAGSASGTITLSNQVAPQYATTLHLMTGASIDGTNGSIIENRLAVTAGSAVNLTSLNNRISDFAGSVATKNGLRLNNAQPLAITTVDEVIGLTSLGDISATSTGNLTTTAAVLSQQGNVALTADRGHIVLTSPVTAPNGQVALTVRGNGVATNQQTVAPYTITALAPVGPRVTLVGTSKLLTSTNFGLHVAGRAPANEVKQTLDAATLEVVKQAAINAWAAAGLSTDDLAKLEKVKVRVGNLNKLAENANLIGAQISDDEIVLDNNAAGRGWSINPNAPRSNRVDLLSAIAHELGHILRLDHAASAESVMHDSLHLGDRHLPTAEEVAAIDTIFADEVIE